MLGFKNILHQNNVSVNCFFHRFREVYLCYPKASASLFCHAEEDSGRIAWQGQLCSFSEPKEGARTWGLPSE